MTMFLGVVEVQHLVGMLQDRGEFARPTVAHAGKSVSLAQQVGTLGRLREVQHLRHPSQRLHYAALRQNVAAQSAEDRQLHVVTLERLRQGEGRMQAGPDIRCPWAPERPPCRSEAAA